MLINGREKVGIEKLRIPKAFTDFSQTIDDVNDNLEDYNPTKKRRVLIVSDDMITYMEFNKKLSPIVNATHYFIMKNSTNCIESFL